MATKSNGIMKAEDLMIGDWVKVNYVNFPYPTQVDGLEKNGGLYYALFPKWDLSVTVDYLKPIRLTRNILESNGWSPVEGVCASILRHNGYNLSILHWAKPGVNLTIDKGGYGPNLVCMPIYYVHELQHALRLCGIDKEIVL